MPWNLLIDAVGTRVRIDGDTLRDDERVAVQRAWADAVAQAVHEDDQSVAERTQYVVWRAQPGEAPVVMASGADLPALLSDLSQRVTLAAIDAQRGKLWMLHAAGVAAPDGRVVVLVGPSGRGKTTAARTVGSAFGYVSDETVGVDVEGRIWAYRKPLSIIEVPQQPKAQRSPSELELGPLPSGPLQLAAIVLLDRREDAADEPVVEALDIGDALADLVEQSSYLTAMSSPLQTIARHAAATGGIRRVTYREASSLIPVVRSLFAAPALSVGRVADEGAPPVGRVADEGAPPVGRVADEGGVSRPLPVHYRTPHLDSLDLDEPDRVAILRESADHTGMVHVLAGVAPAVWRAASAASLAMLVEAAVDAYGTPDDADPESLVSAAVAELIDAGVLSTERHWRLRDDVAWVDRAERAVVLSLSDPAAAPLALEGSAAAIWGALDEAEWRSTDAVAQRVADAVGVDASDVYADVAVFLAALASASLIAGYGG